jgi:hypothetical protein
MTKSSTVKAPSIGPKGLNHKQGAGQAAQGATNAIQLQQHRLSITSHFDIERQHSSTRPSFLD